MSSHVRRIERASHDWRTAQAAAHEAGAAAIDKGLREIDDLVALFDGDDSITGALRGVAGHLRTRRNDWLNEALNLRSAAGSADDEAHE